MKRLLFFIFASTLLPLTMLAQRPQGFNYHTIVRNAEGEVMSNQEVAFRMSILQGTSIDASTTVYTEVHMHTTNNYGLADLEIGMGLVESGDFSEIDWGQDYHYLQVELDEAGGNDFEVMGISQLLSVPYALFAAEADTVLNAPDTSPSNEIQELSLKGDTLFISKGNSVVLPGLTLLSSVQGRLDLGIPPINLFNSGIPLDSLYGKMYQGGIIFYLDTQDTIPGLEGLVVSTHDLEVDGISKLNWGCYPDAIPSLTNVNFFPPTGDGAKIGAGKRNTDLIINGCDDENIAAKVARNYRGGGLSDWFLPSIQELNQIYEHIGPVAPAPNTNAGGFSTMGGEVTYWSSTQFENAAAWTQNMLFVGPIEGPIATNKNNPQLVRAVRAF